MYYLNSSPTDESMTRHQSIDYQSILKMGPVAWVTDIHYGVDNTMLTLQHKDRSTTARRGE